MDAADFFRRMAGVLLHPTSLPSGKLDGDAEKWLSLLHQCGMQVWQVLPLGEPQFGLSPYQCVSAFALNPELLDDYPEFDSENSSFKTFCQHHNSWLNDYALFKLIKEQQNQSAWYEWPDEFKFRDQTALDRLQQRYSDELSGICWQQYCLFDRWLQIKQYAQQKNIRLFGDMPIFVAHDSVDVWVCPSRYLLDENGMMKYVTGVPPDYFSETGQRWGNPHYDWAMMQNENFSWWINRLDYHFELFDLVRIDHFRGLESVWMINAESETAVDGFFQKVPGDQLLETVQQTTGQLPIVAEDLGIITKEVTQLRKKFHLPGMAVLQFSFDAFDDNPHKVKNIKPDCVVYTGTHDNDTTKGWYQQLDIEMRQQVLASLDIGREHEVEDQPEDWTLVLADEVVDKMMIAALNSQASLCILPFQDCLHLDSQARMNTPGTIENNWCWQFQWNQINNSLAPQFKNRVEESGRYSRDDS